MSDYRKEAKHGIKEARWTIWKVLPLVLLVITILFGIGAFLKIGGKMVDRQVMVNSHQYKEGMEQRAAVLEANIAEIDVQLRMGKGDVDSLEGQKMILNAHLKAITK